MPFTGYDIGSRRLASVTESFQDELASTDSFEIVGRRKIAKLLKEPRYQDTGACGAMDCSVEIGKRLGVEGVFTGIVSKEAESWRLEVKLTDLETGRTEFRHLIEIYGSYGDILGDGCARMAKIASGRETPENDYTVLEIGHGRVWPWIAGGIVAVGGAAAGVLLFARNSTAPNSAAPSNGTPPDQLIVKW
jgi:hypothetical protein